MLGHVVPIAALLITRAGRRFPAADLQQRLTRRLREDLRAALDAAIVDGVPHALVIVVAALGRAVLQLALGLTHLRDGVPEAQRRGHAGRLRRRLIA